MFRYNKLPNPDRDWTVEIERDAALRGWSYCFIGAKGNMIDEEYEIFIPDMWLVLIEDHLKKILTPKKEFDGN